MKAVRYVLVKSDQDYNNEIDFAGGKLVINSSIESVANINREATVVSSPEGTVLEEGDTVIIHHNIMRRKNDIKGNEIKSPFHLEGNIYFVPPTEIFAYKRGDGEWKALDPFCFVKPIELEKEKVLDSGIILTPTSKDSFKGRENGVGILRFANRELEESEGIFPGDKVHFEPFSEHEFEIDGEVLYKMRTQDILAKEPV